MKMNHPLPAPAAETARVAETMEKAEAALAAADAKELHRLFIDARNDYAKIMGVLSTVVEHYAGAKDCPRYQPTEAAEAMRDVALAAIELAKATIGRGGT